MKNKLQKGQRKWKRPRSDIVLHWNPQPRQNVRRKRRNSGGFNGTCATRTVRWPIYIAEAGKSRFMITEVPSRWNRGAVSPFPEKMLGLPVCTKVVHTEQTSLYPPPSPIIETAPERIAAPVLKVQFENDDRTREQISPSVSLTTLFGGWKVVESGGLSCS